jgi:transposase
LPSLSNCGRISVSWRSQHIKPGKRLWLARIMERRPVKVAAVVLANKIARMAWAMMAKGECYNEPAALVA